MSSKTTQRKQLIRATVVGVIKTPGDGVEGPWFWVSVSIGLNLTVEDEIARTAANRLQALLRAGATSVPAVARESLDDLQRLADAGRWLTRQKFRLLLVAVVRESVADGTISACCTADFGGWRNYTLS
jgi:hypothetical protein